MHSFEQKVAEGSNTNANAEQLKLGQTEDNRQAHSLIIDPGDCEEAAVLSDAVAGISEKTQKEQDEEGVGVGKDEASRSQRGVLCAVEECGRPFLRHSSSVSTIDGTTKHHMQDSKQVSSQSPPLLSGGIPLLPSRSSQVPPDVLSQKTSQGGFVWETQTQTQDVEFQYLPDGQEGVLMRDNEDSRGAAGGWGRMYPSVVPDSFVDVPDCPTGSFSTRIPPRIQASESRLFQVRSLHACLK